MSDRGAIVSRIQDTARRMRLRALDLALSVGAKSSHLGGGLSMIDITATLYSAIMRIDRNNPEWPDRDRFILSKGHAVLGYYTALLEAGYLTPDEFMSYEKPGSFLLGHPVMNRAHGIEFSNGSLGMGLGLGIGVALAGRRRGKDYRVFVMIGDGECNEGSVWEAAMAAPNFGLDNLTVIIDRNRIQQTGTNEAIMDIRDAAAKWKSFGWHTIEIQGHDVEAIYDALGPDRRPASPGQPTAIIAHTIKGKGVSFMENTVQWHHNILTRAQYDAAVVEINAPLAPALDPA